MTAKTRREIVVIALISITVATAAFVMVRKRWHAPPAPTVRTIAVLPFTPVSTDQRIALLEQQILLAIIGSIDSSARLTVTSPAGADAVLRGTIDTSEQRIRIEAHLWRVSDGRDIWHGRFDRPREDMAALQESIAEQVIEAAGM